MRKFVPFRLSLDSVIPIKSTILDSSSSFSHSDSLAVVTEDKDNKIAINVVRIF
jgi:hypothetical protein